MSQPRAVVLTTLACASLIVSCVSVPQAARDADEAAKSFAAPPGKARLYCYRPSSIWRGVYNTVAVDGAVLGVVAPGRYLITDVDPGCHVVFSDWVAYWDDKTLLSVRYCYGSATANVAVERDSVYFVKIHSHRERTLSVMPESAGDQDVRRSRLAVPVVRSPACSTPPAHCTTFPGSPLRDRIAAGWAQLRRALTVH
jgi:hypothetical protein